MITTRLGAAALVVSAGLMAILLPPVAEADHPERTRTYSTDDLTALVDAGKASSTVRLSATRKGVTGDEDIECVGAFRNNQSYDSPHPGKSSNRRAINAHLAINCSGPGFIMTKVHVESVMIDGRRAGELDDDDGMGKARTGGDLRCVKSKRSYQAKGFVHVTFPPGYSPPVGVARPVSPIKSFKRAPTGRCVRP